MRLQLKLTGNLEPVAFDHLHQLTGVLHDRIGANPLHDTASLYSFSWLQGGIKQDDYLAFPHGAAWTVSLYDDEASRKLVAGFLHNPEVLAGMRVFEIHEQAVPAFNGCYRFLVDGPVILRKKVEGRSSPDYLLWDDPAADEAMTRILRWKLKQAGFSGEHLETRVQFDRTYRRARTKLATIKGISHRGSECPVVVTGTPDAVRFAWLVGIGELTGSGFGALR